MKKLKVGPILGVESNSLYTVCFSTGHDVAQAAVLIGEQTVSAEKVGTTPSSVIWRAQYDVDVTNEPQSLTYQVSVDGDIAQCQNLRQAWSFYVPGLNTPPRLAYASCNGFSALDLMHKTQNPYRLWDEMLEQHQQEPFSILLMGGDQLYADDIWSSVSELKKWNCLSQEEKIARSATKALSKQVDVFYDNLYQTRWTNKSMSLLFATVPSVMMWDDHDIFDGWGSYPAELQNCDVFQEIFKIARRYFEFFQIRSCKNTALLSSNSDHYAHAFGFRDYHILALDNRAERTLNQVMSSDQWSVVNGYLNNMEADGHLLVLSAVPVVYRDFSFTESVVDFTSWEEELTDDLKDHWRAKEHQGERARLIHRLLDNAKKRRATNPNNKTIILSGDVHIGSIGVINDKAKACKIHQVVSSGIVHPAPSRLQWIGIMAVTNDRDEYLDEDRDIHISMLQPFASDQYIRCRNYVTLSMGTDEKLWVNWVSEGKDAPYYPIQ